MKGLAIMLSALYFAARQRHGLKHLLAPKRGFLILLLAPNISGSHASIIFLLHNVVAGAYGGFNAAAHNVQLSKSRHGEKDLKKLCRRCSADNRSTSPHKNSTSPHKKVMCA